MKQDLARIEQFLDALWLEKNLAENTLNAYRRDLSMMVEWLHHRGLTLATAQSDDLQALLAERLEGGYKATSSARLLSAVRRLFQYLYREKFREDDPSAHLASPKLPQRLPKDLSEAQVERLLQAPLIDQPLELRDKAMLEVLYATGLRVSELVGLTMSDISLRQGVVRVIGKGNKERLVPLGEEAVYWLETYLEHGRPWLLNGVSIDVLFPSQRAQQMTRQTFWHRIKHYAVLANELDALNQTRKEIEQGMQVEALTLCEKLERSRDTLPGGLAMYHPEWHQGVVGILASRIKERFHRPVIAFAPAGDGTLKGSGRSIQGLHMRDALERLDTLYPGMMLKFGGHAMAAGLSLEEDKFELFQQRFGELVTEWLDPSLLQGEVVSDGPLSAAEMTMEVAQLLRDAGPWGQMFPEPLFDGHFRLLQQRLVGERHLKVMVEPVGGGPLLDGIAFNVDTALWPDNGVREVQLAYKLDINEFRGNRSLQIIIDNIWPI